jgi:hypothetical protein
MQVIQYSTRRSHENNRQANFKNRRAKTLPVRRQLPQVGASTGYSKVKEIGQALVAVLTLWALYWLLAAAAYSFGY